jgi:hypothetical protein
MIVMMVLNVPDDYEGEPAVEAMRAICAQIPAELRAWAHAAIREAAQPFIDLAGGDPR